MAQGLTLVAAALVLGACGTSGGQSASGGTSAGGAGMSASAGTGGAGDAGSASAAGRGGASGSATGGETSAAGSVSQAGAGGSAGVSGGASVGTQCRTDQPFKTPKPIAELNTKEHEAGARLTSDELTIVYLCASYDTICLAQRKSRAEPFGKPQTIVASAGGVAWISDDTLTLLFEDEAASNVKFSQRATAQAPFPGAAIYLLDYGDPYVVGGSDGHLYASAVRAKTLQVAQLTAWKPAVLKPVLGGTTTHGDVRPVVTPDELTLYFAAAPAVFSTTPRLDIWVKQRKSTQDDFGAPVSVSELNTTSYNFPSWISPDGCRLYFDSGADLRDLYVAER